LKILVPELERLFGIPQRPEHHPEIDAGLHVMMVVDAAAGMACGLSERFAALMHDLGKGLTPDWLLPSHKGHEKRGVKLVSAVCERLRIPGDCRDLAALAARFHGMIHGGSYRVSPKATLRVLELTDAIRRKNRFASLLDVAAADSRGRLGHANDPYPQKNFWLDALHAASSVQTGAIARLQKDGPGIRQAIHTARLQALQTLFAQKSGQG
jgi:tRNA nucleotidyltransferase (CCA-adding enzyme)